MGLKNNEKPEKTENLKKQCLSLRTTGLSYSKIAVRVGISPAYAQKLTKQAIKEIAQDEREELLKIETERLDKLQEAASQPLAAIQERIEQLELAVINGDEKAATLFATSAKELKGVIDANLAIMNRRASMLGLDEPKKTDITTKGEKLDSGSVFFYMPDNGRDSA